MKVAKKNWRQQAGKKGYLNRLQHQSKMEMRKKGAEYAKRRTKESYNTAKFKDKENASACGRLGGACSKRGRHFDIDTDMTIEEWQTLTEIASELKLHLLETHLVDEEEMQKAELNYIRDALLVGDWIGFFVKPLRLEIWYEGLGEIIERKCSVFYNLAVKGKELTEDQKEQYRWLRNVRAAWKTALKINGERIKNAIIRETAETKNH